MVECEGAEIMRSAFFAFFAYFRIFRIYFALSRIFSIFPHIFLNEWTAGVGTGPADDNRPGANNCFLNVVLQVFRQWLASGFFLSSTVNLNSRHEALDIGVEYSPGLYFCYCVIKIKKNAYFDIRSRGKQNIPFSSQSSDGHLYKLDSCTSLFNLPIFIVFAK